MINYKRVMKQFGNTKLSLRQYKNLLSLKSHVLKGTGAQFLSQHSNNQFYYGVHDNKLYSNLGPSSAPMTKAQVLKDLNFQIHLNERNPTLRKSKTARTLIAINHHHGQLSLHVHANQSFHPEKTALRETLGKDDKTVAHINRRDYKDLFKLGNILKHHGNIYKFLNSHSNLETRLYVHANKQNQLILNNGKSFFDSEYQFGEYVNKITKGMRFATGITASFKHQVHQQYQSPKINTKSIQHVAGQQNRGKAHDNQWNRANSQRFVRQQKENRIHSRPRIRRVQQTSLHLE